MGVGVGELVGYLLPLLLLGVGAFDAGLFDGLLEPPIATVGDDDGASEVGVVDAPTLGIFVGVQVGVLAVGVVVGPEEEVMVVL